LHFPAVKAASLLRAGCPGRDCAGREITRANLFLADMNGAKLANAKPVGASMGGANRFCANLPGADLILFIPYRVDMQCATGLGTIRWTSPFRLSPVPPARGYGEASPASRVRRAIQWIYGANCPTKTRPVLRRCLVPVPPGPVTRPPPTPRLGALTKTATPRYPVSELTSTCVSIRKHHGFTFKISFLPCQKGHLRPAIHLRRRAPSRSRSDNSANVRLHSASRSISESAGRAGMFSSR
jgi:hypothetical protein